MIEAEHSVPVAVPIERVWDYVAEIRNWAQLMPGLQECDIIDADNSRWTLKVGVGGMVRTVRVKVLVDKWDGPGRVDFSYKLEGDPVEGGGTYVATRNGDETEMTLKIRVIGSGPVAPMWEAMGRPLLPQFVKAFAGQLRAGIEESVGVAASREAPRASLLARLGQWFAGLWRKLFGAAPAA